MTDSTTSSRDRSLSSTVAVFGGSGFVGRSLCARLASHGRWRVVVVTRDSSSAKQLAHLPNTTIQQADAFDDEALRTIVGSVDGVVNLVAILHGNPRQFNRVHVQLPQRLATACRQARKRLVHVSALGIAQPGESWYMQSKAWGEHTALTEWRETTVLRPSVIFGAADHFINTFARLQRFVPFVPLACSEALFQPVWVEDVARAIVACLDRPSTAGQVHECVGPDVLTLRQLVERAGRWAGSRRPIVRLPLALAYAQAWLMECLPGEPLMSRDNLRSMQTPNIGTVGTLSLNDLGITPLSIDDYLSRR